MLFTHVTRYQLPPPSICHWFRLFAHFARRWRFISFSQITLMKDTCESSFSHQTHTQATEDLWNIIFPFFTAASSSWHDRSMRDGDAMVFLESVSESFSSARRRQRNNIKFDIYMSFDICFAIALSITIACLFSRLLCFVLFSLFILSLLTQFECPLFVRHNVYPILLWTFLYVTGFNLTNLFATTINSDSRLYRTTLNKLLKKRSFKHIAVVRHNGKRESRGLCGEF